MFMRKRTLVLAVVVLFSAGACWMAYGINAHPSLAPYRSYLLPATNTNSPALRVVFLGVSTLLLDDGETAILTDGFFTRPRKLQLLGKIEPDRELIGRLLERAGISRLAAVIAVHSHYDHAMDSPEVAQRTGALLIGSSSTANIGRGAGMAEDRLRIRRQRPRQ